MESGGHYVSLPNQGGEAFAPCEHLYSRPGLNDARRSNEYHFKRAARKRCFRGDYGRINLAAIGVALHCCIQHTQAALNRIANIARKENRSGAGSEDRVLLTVLFERIKEVPLLEELQHRGGFAARQDKRVEARELLRFAHVNRLGPGFDQSLGMGRVVSLNCQHANARARAMFVQSPFPELSLPASRLQQL